ncbi:Phytochrome-like protein cph2 [compost metagenome]
MPFHLDIGDIFVSTNIGIAMYPYDGNTQEELLKHADQAMYAAKDQGRNTYQFFEQDMRMKVPEKMIFEQYLQG